jgi:hypothetical protein
MPHASIAARNSTCNARRTVVQRPVAASLLALGFLAVAPAALTAHAAIFTVTNLNDSGAGSLRQAILNANANANAATGTLATDQRGAGFLRIAGSAVDIGAIEFGSGGAAQAALTVVPTLSAFFLAMLAALIALSAFFQRERKCVECNR